MQLKPLLMTLMALLPLGMMAQTELTSSDLENAYNQKNYARITCHDPSIVIDNITNSSSPKYYIYGSHLGRGYTTVESNYADWTTFKVGEESTDATNSLFANTSGTLVNFANAYSTQKITKIKNLNGSTVTFSNFDAHGWQYNGNTVAGNEWAPDIIYNTTMKKWCLYESLNGDYWCSTIVCFTSDSPEGPWVYQGPVICGGFSGKYTHNSYSSTNDWKNTDLAIATGCTSLPTRYNVSNWGDYWPNCIDPCVFYDDSGNLWMSYGSWSGGIFIIRLDKSNGLRDYTYKFPYQVNGTTVTEGSANKNCTSDPYFGKKIAGGWYVSGEASYIEKIGNYYFLFTSYGGFASDGGYQMRIFRSSSPDGPYVDAYGTSAVYTDKYEMNYGPKAATNRGVLLMGGYQWPLMSSAEICQGHNSAFTDLSGRAFVVCHTRFNDGTEGHAVRVHQLFLNQDNWIMAAPYEFSGETITNSQIASTASIANSEIPGCYQFIRHQYNQDYENKAYEKPVDIYLNSDGSVTGGESGTWTRTSGTDYITLTLSNVTYKGVLVRQTIDYSNMPAICICALSSSSGSLTIGQSTFTYQQEVWASKTDVKSAIKYTLDKNTPPFSSGSTIASNVTLPTTGYFGCTVTWTTSNSNIISSTGTVNGSGSVILTQIVSRDGYEYKKYYNLTVNKGGTEDITYYPESSAKDLTSAWWSNFSRADYTLTKGKTLKFKFYNHSSKGGNWQNYCLYGASATHGSSSYTEYFGIRADNWDNTTGGSTGCTCNYNWDTFLSDLDGALVEMTVDYTSAGVFTMSANITTTSGTTYTQGYTKTISSSPSSIVLFFVNEASYIDGSSCAPQNTPQTITYYPESTTKDLTADWWTNFSTADYTLDKGNTLKFKFYNHSAKEGSYQNYCLYGASATHGSSNYTEYFGVRADNWDNTTWSSSGCTTTYSGTSFTDDMDGALVEMTVNYTSSGVFTMTSEITSTSGNVFTQTYTKTIDSSPSSIVLFFVNEKSYIDGTQSETEDLQKDISLRFTSANEVSGATSSFNIGDFTIAAASNKTVTVAASSRTIGRETFTDCLKFGGGGDATGRYISFPVYGPCYIRVFGISANNTAERSLTLAYGSNALGTTLKNDLCKSQTDGVWETYHYTGSSSTTMYLYSTNSGYNVYGVDVVYSLPTGDVNGDGYVTIADLAKLIAILNGSATDNLGKADVNGDGSINKTDIDALKSLIFTSN